MSRERLMAQQRARLEARRKRLAEQKKKEQAKTKKKGTDYSSGSRLGSTRNTSNDKSRKAATTKRLTGGTTPKTGDAARKVLGIKPKNKPVPAGKVPAPKPAQPPRATTPKPTAPSSKGRERFFAGGKGGKYDKSSPKNLKMSEHPGLKQNQKPKKPKLGATKTVKGQAYYYDGSKWVKGKLGKTTRLK